MHPPCLRRLWAPMTWSWLSPVLRSKLPYPSSSPLACKTCSLWPLISIVTNSIISYGYFLRMRIICWSPPRLIWRSNNWTWGWPRLGSCRHVPPRNLKNESLSAQTISYTNDKSLSEISLIIEMHQLHECAALAKGATYFLHDFQYRDYLFR